MNPRAAAGILILALLGTPSDALPAVPTAVPTSGIGPLTVTFSPNNPNGSFYEWQFNFIAGSPFVADHSSEVGEDVSYTYQAPGTYVARLRVYDAITGIPADSDVTITVFPPPAPPVVDLTLSPFPTLATDTVTFTATATASPGRTVTNYFWDLDNDGSIDVSSPGGPSAVLTSNYPTIGVHPVAVTATDNGGLANTATVDVKISTFPVASIPEPVTRLAAPGVPLQLGASATATAPFAVGSYSWDFGDGTTGTSPGGPTTSVAHAFAAPGVYAVMVQAVDTAGYVSLPKFFPVTVADPPSLLLRQHFNLAIVTAMVFPPPGDALSVIEWDFDDDGSVDATDPPGPDPAAGHGVTRAVSGNIVRVTVTFVTSPTPLTDTQSIMFAVQDPPPPPPQIQIPVFIALTASVDGSAPSGGPISTRVGHVVNLVADVQSLFGDPLGRVLWDFDRDRLRDQMDDLSALGATQAFVPASFQFQSPGTYVVSAKGLLQVGGEAETTITINVAPGTAPLECWIAQPRTGKRVYGNHVSVHARVAPAALAARVDFQFRPSGSGGAWTPIGFAVPPPYSSLSVPWDVRGLPPGDYDLRALGTNTSGGPPADSETIQVVRVTVDPQTPDEEENFSGAGPITRIHTVSPEGPTRTEIARDTALEIPSQALLGRTTVRMERPFSNPHPLEARFQGLNFVTGSFRRLSLGDGTDLQQPSKISLYDTNPNGVLDGLNVDRSKLKIYQFDSVQGQWIPLFAQVVQPSEDLIRATLVSMGDVGLVVEALPRAPSGSSESGCGLMGPEVLILPLLATVLRRRRSKPRRN